MLVGDLGAGEVRRFGLKTCRLRNGRGRRHSRRAGVVGTLAGRKSRLKAASSATAAPQEDPAPAPQNLPPKTRPPQPSPPGA